MQITSSSDIQLHSTITCPNCGHQALETMSTDACQFFYDCKGCKRLLKPTQGDCCVFCSFGDVPCPPIQESRSNGNSKDCCIHLDQWKYEIEITFYANIIGNIA